MGKYLTLSLVLLLCWTNLGCLGAEENIEKEVAPKIAVQEQVTRELPKLKVVHKPIKWTDQRERLIKEYAQMHYGKDITSIVPQVIITHWTVSNDAESVYQYFYSSKLQ